MFSVCTHFVQYIKTVMRLQYCMILFHVCESNASFNALLFQNPVMVMLIQCIFLANNASSMHYFQK